MTSKSKTEPVVWALLAPAGASQLKKKVDAFWKSKKPNPEYHPEKWKVEPGERAYSAIINRNAGTDETYEIPLATELSRELSGPVYVLYPQDAYTEADAIHVYEKGKEKGTDPDDPYFFAASLGIPLRTSKPKPKLTTRSVVIVEGVSATDAARALDFDVSPRGPSLSIEDGKRGAVLSSFTVGDLAPLASDLTSAFPDASIYVLSSGPTPERLYVEVLSNGKTLGVYDSPNPVTVTSGGPPPLTSIKGETTREGIIKAFDIPLELLKIDDD